MKFRITIPKKLFFFGILFSLAYYPVIQAQYVNFGKNRVQYQQFEWRFIQSKHFDVYYYGDKNYELAEFAAKSIESAYQQLSEDFQHEIVSRIPLIIYDSHNDFSQTNVVALPTSAEGIGGVTDKMKNRMTVPFDGDYNDFRRTLHHELVHAVFNDLFYGGSIQSILRNNIQLVLPLWFEEGLAEYMALGWDTNTDMFIRDAVLNNYLPPIPYLSGYYAYRGGQSVWNFIAEEYGREKIAEVLEKVKSTRSVENGFQQSIGLTVQELSERWEDALRKRYFPEVADRELADRIATLMTERGDYGSYNTSPKISPQGDRIAFITNKRGYFDVIVIDALTKKRLKTVIRGEDDPAFEELNILKPNLSWSPDGRKIVLSTKSKGFDEIAIIDYQSTEVEKISIPELDAIGSVSWSPDGTKLAFDGNIGPYQDIFMYDLNEKQLINLTQDFVSDYEPSWTLDSKRILFSSERGNLLALKQATLESTLLEQKIIYQSDIYQLEIGSDTLKRITLSKDWNEHQPQQIQDGTIIFQSDQNGIQNLYQTDPITKEWKVLTNLQTGISQFSISADGSRVAFSSINEGYLDIFLLKNPLNNAKAISLKPNYWAQRRGLEAPEKRVPAIRYAYELYSQGLLSGAEREELEEEERLSDPDYQVVDFEETGEIDFRNYVFSEEVILDSTILLEDEFIFEPNDNITTDGRYVPRAYRLTFSTDIAYSPTVAASTYGAYALAQFMISDLLGDHQLAMGTNFQTDLRNSDYTLQYGFLKNRMNWFASYFHTSRQYQTFGGDLLRFRTFGGGISIQYPFDKFTRIDGGLNWIGIARDYDAIAAFGGLYSYGVTEASNLESSFLYPTMSFTKDATLPGFITPQGGIRYTLNFSGSPSLGTDAPSFASVMGDFRSYINLGYSYTIALRGSGGASVGKDSQTYFLGGMMGWINYKWSNYGIPFERLADTFFTQPAVPLRGHRYNSVYGDNFGLINAEFRFPLFAAVIPGALPILPLYNVTGVAFFDVGTAWGQQINYGITDIDGNPIINDASLDFKVSEPTTFQDENGDIFSYLDGDVLIGSGFGLRTIVFGLPLRYDVGWAYNRDGFSNEPIHYFSIGIDF